MKTGLILTGGGARAAYQAGVLAAVSVLLREAGWPAQKNPFDIFCGTSAGALNGTIVACRADDFSEGVNTLLEVWNRIEAAQVYRVDPLGIVSTGSRWLSQLSFGWISRHWYNARTSSLLDNTPLVDQLHRLLDLPRLDAAFDAGSLYALAITASSYTTGQHRTFYQTAEDEPSWQCKRRSVWRDQIGVQHLLASSAIPIVFPAVPLYCDGRIEYCGDGAMRQVAPIAPAIHLGAHKVFVVGADRLANDDQAGTAGSVAYPTLAQVAGQAMSGIFLDTLAADMNRLERINKLAALLTPEQLEQSGLRSIEMLVIAPSESLEEIASRHIKSLPRTIRALLSGIGATEMHGSALASYLLFEASFAHELIQLGQRDTLARRKDVLAFFGGPHRESEPFPLQRIA